MLKSEVYGISFFLPCVLHLSVSPNGAHFPQQIHHQRLRLQPRDQSTAHRAALRLRRVPRACPRGPFGRAQGPLAVRPRGARDVRPRLRHPDLERALRGQVLRDILLRCRELRHVSRCRELVRVRAS